MVSASVRVKGKGCKSSSAVVVERSKLRWAMFSVPRFPLDGGLVSSLKRLSSGEKTGSAIMARVLGAVVR